MNNSKNLLPAGYCDCNIHNDSFQKRLKKYSLTCEICQCEHYLGCAEFIRNFKTLEDLIFAITVKCDACDFKSRRA